MQAMEDSEEMMKIIIKQQQNFNTYYKERSKMKVAQREDEFAAKQARQDRLDAKKEAKKEFRLIMMDYIG